MKVNRKKETGSLKEFYLWDELNPKKTEQEAWEELKVSGGPAKLKDHFHKNCLTCHKALKKEGKPTGPTSCKGCHNRKGG